MDGVQLIEQTALPLFTRLFEEASAAIHSRIAALEEKHTTVAKVVQQVVDTPVAQEGISKAQALLENRVANLETMLEAALKKLNAAPPAPTAPAGTDTSGQ